MLRKMHLNALKIDRPFVRRIGGRPEDKTKVDTMINLGHRMNLRVIAEGWKPSNNWNFFGNMAVMKRKGTISASRCQGSSCQVVPAVTMQSQGAH